MKQLLLVALLASLASSAVTLLVAGAFRSPPPPAGSPSAAVDFKGALADLEREVAALRREAAERDGAVAGLRADPGPGASLLPRPSAPPGSPVVRDARAAEEPVPATDTRRRFLEVLPRTPEGESDTVAQYSLKRRWLLRGEREVLDWFGLPMTIQPEGELETWLYEVPSGAVDEEGNPEHDNFWIKINRGRVVEMGD